MERKMIEFASERTQERNAAIRPEVGERCAICWRPVTGELTIRTAQGVFAVAIDAPEPAANEDTGTWAIGPECARKLGKRFVSARG